MMPPCYTSRAEVSAYGSPLCSCLCLYLCFGLDALCSLLCAPCSVLRASASGQVPVHCTEAHQLNCAVQAGVVFMGRQAPGGHDAIGGMYDALKKHHTDSELLEFVGGSAALFKSEFKLVYREKMRWHRS